MSINVLEDVTEHKRRERVQRLLAETGRVLGSLLDPEEMLTRVAEVLVPELADWCVVYLTPDPGSAITAVTMVVPGGGQGGGGSPRARPLPAPTATTRSGWRA